MEQRVLRLCVRCVVWRARCPKVQRDCAGITDAHLSRSEGSTQHHRRHPASAVTATKNQRKSRSGRPPGPPGRPKIEPRTLEKSIRGASWTIWGVPGRFGDASGALLDALGTLQGAPGALPGRPRGTVWLHGRATGASRRILEARSDAFFVRYGHRPDFWTIFVRCFDENSIDFVEQLLDDRRSLDDAFVVPARTHDI